MTKVVSMFSYYPSEKKQCDGDPDIYEDVIVAVEQIDESDRSLQLQFSRGEEMYSIQLDPKALVSAVLDAVSKS